MPDTITIGCVTFVEAPLVEKPKPKPRPRYYCPDCGPKPRPSAALCTPNRNQFTGMTAKRCKKHSMAKYHRDMDRARDKMYLDHLYRRR